MERDNPIVKVMRMYKNGDTEYIIGKELEKQTKYESEALVEAFAHGIFPPKVSWTMITVPKKESDVRPFARRSFVRPFNSSSFARSSLDDSSIGSSNRSKSEEA